MKNHENEVIGVLQLLNAKNRKTGEFFAFREHSEGVVSSLASQAAVALTNNRLVSNLQKNFEEIQELQASEEELNNKLRDAFRDVEHKNSELEGALKKVRMIRYYALAFIVLIGIGGGLYSTGMLRSLSGALEQFSRSQQVEEPVPSARRSATVSRGPVSASITMSGTLKPLRTVNVPSSIAGTISQINFEYGGNVKEKQLLVKLNAEKLESEYREATTELIQAEDEFEVLENWENSLEVVKAKRAIDNAKIAVEKAERDLTYAEKLFKMEIISANELESSQATLHTAKESHQTALEQLEVTLAKAGEAEMLIAENKLNSARAKVAALEAKLDKIVAVAPISGVILDPGAGVGRAGSLLDVGSEVKAGAVLARIGDLSGFSIEARVDEVDVGKVKEGQTVLVTGDAFPGSVLRGKVASLSSQASGGTQGFGGERPSFHLLVEVKNIKRRLRKKLRVGMSANLEIITYKNDKALLLPVEAVQMMGADTGLVMRQPAGQVAPEQVEVKVGRTTLDSVEILEGLHENDTILY